MIIKGLHLHCLLFSDIAFIMHFSGTQESLNLAVLHVDSQVIILFYSQPVFKILIVLKNWTVDW